MNLKQFYLTENECYKRNVKISPKGFMLHSTGANNPNLKRYVPNFDGSIGNNSYNNHWNQYRPDGRQVCVHGFIGKLADGTIATVQTLPWDMKGWHCAGKGNDYLIGVEICEDGLSDPIYFNEVYKEAVELVVMLAKMYNWDINEDTVLCHSEGAKKGIASNHSDVMHWFPKHGKSMDTFRADVKASLGSNTVNTVVNNTNTGVNYLVKITANVLNVRAGAGTNYKINTTVKKDEVYTIVEENNGWGKLKSGAGWISLAYTTKNTTTTQSSTNYYKACSSKYTSIVDGLNSIGVDSSFAYRKKIAAKNNVKDYSGTAVQNNQLLAKLKAGKLKVV